MRSTMWLDHYFQFVCFFAGFEFGDVIRKLCKEMIECALSAPQDSSNFDIGNTVTSSFLPQLAACS